MMTRGGSLEVSRNQRRGYWRSSREPRACPSTARGASEPPSGEPSSPASITQLHNYTQHIVARKMDSTWLLALKNHGNNVEIVFNSWLIIFSSSGLATERICYTTIQSCWFFYSSSLDRSSYGIFRTSLRTTYILSPWEGPDYLGRKNLYGHTLQ